MVIPELFEEFRAEEIETSLTVRFGSRVRRHPDFPAVRSGNHEITYAGLDGFCNRVARTLTGAPAGVDAPIALLFDPGIPMIAAILGVLKAGGFYVPLDPASPPARNHEILRVSGASILLTDSKNFSAATGMGGPRARVLNVEALDDRADDPPVVFPSADTRACVLYTSGSSGAPKGVVHNHRNFLQSIRGHTISMQIHPGDRISMLAFYGHVAGVTAMWRALLNGARLCIFNLRAEGWGELPRWLAAEGVTIYQSAPTLFRQWAQALTDSHRLPNLRILHLGGEPVTIHDVELYRKYCPPQCRLVHNLGSTEAPTIRQLFIDKETGFKTNLVPVGFPVEGKEVLLWGDAGNEVGSGEVGEIVVRSRYLALEYWRNPELTRKAFLDDPAGGRNRLFRTGDLGRVQADGCLEHLGRADRQVKIRGIRVEPAEIEAVLAGHPEVRQAAVVARPDARGEMQLAAYVVGERGAAIPNRALRDHLRSHLPAHMVPGAYVNLDRMPLTPSGKVDQRALPEPGPAIRESEVPYVAPRTDIERTIAAIWEEVLGVPGVGVEDRFLDLGGNSLRAMQVITRLQNALGGILPLEPLFDIATVAQQAAAVESHLAMNGDARLLAELEAMSDEEAQRHLDALEAAGGDGPGRRSSHWQGQSVTSAYLDLRTAIPGRELGIEIMLKVIRSWQPNPRRVLDIGCGDGVLGRRITEQFSESHTWFLDFSEPMLAAVRRLLPDPGRATVLQGDFASPAWLQALAESRPFDLIVSGLAIHHQPDPRKRQLYAEIHGILSPGGVFLNFEQVASASPAVEEIYCDFLIDHLHAYQRQAAREKSRMEVAERFYADPARKENILAPVEMQCQWLREIGFQDVDCFFKSFEHALFGGRRSAIST